MKSHFRAALFIGLVTLTVAGCDKPASSKNSEVPDFPQRALEPEMERLCNRIYKKNKRGKRISWKGKVPIVFSIDASFPPDFIPSVKSAIDTWNKAAGFELFRMEPKRRDTSVPTTDGLNTFYFSTNDGLKFEHDLAVTIASGQANQIVDTDIVFHGTGKPFDVERTALHELGHALGMEDNLDSTSTMFYADSSPGFASRVLDETTKQMIGCEYP